MKAAAIDASAQIFDNTKIDGPVELRNWLSKNYSVSSSGRDEKLLTYALGRGVEYQDMPLVRAIARDVVAERRPVLGAGPGRRQEPAVSDEHQVERTARRQPPRLRGLTPRPRESTEPCRSSPRDTFRAGRSCKGAGVTLALPLLEAMVPASTALAQTAAAAEEPRFVGIFFPHGMAPGHWEPAAEGALPDEAALHPGVAREA